MISDKEKVKKGLQAHAEGCGHRSIYCDFMECPYRICDESCDIEQMCIDTLILLKEQEAIIEQYHKADGFLDIHGWKWETNE